MKSILNVAACQAVNLTIGSRPNANSKRSLSSNKIGIVFSDSVQIQETEIDTRRMETMEGTNQ